jgi:DNA-binding SARP family transcriptional activator
MPTKVRRKEGGGPMARVYIRLFGGFSITDERGFGIELHPRKLRDLFCYLLIRQNRNLPREVVASDLWERGTTAQSKKYLRTALWQLRRLVDTSLGARDALQVDPLNVRLNTGLNLWSDVAEMERVYHAAARARAGRLDDRMVATIKMSVALYSGELLPGNYYEWCLHERERFQEMYLELVDKLLAQCEIERDCPALQRYGSILLHYHPFSEHIYRRLMRGYCLSGDRGSALALYRQCSDALQKHLQVKPSNVTFQLYQQIRSGTPIAASTPGFLVDVRTGDDCRTDLRKGESVAVDRKKHIRADRRASN